MSNENQENTPIAELIKAGSEIAGNVSGAIIGGAILGPMGLIIGSATGPIITRLFTKVGEEVKKRVLGDREESRIGYTYTVGFSKIKFRLENGDKHRNDDFFESRDSDRSAAEEILEGVLRSAQIEYQEKKLQYYGNLLANIAFDSSISRDKANLLLKIAQNLTYQQLCILQLLSQCERIKLDWSHNFNRLEDLQKYNNLEPSIVGLENYKLLLIIGQNYPAINGIIITKLGQELAQLMDLCEINHVDIKSLEDDLSEVKEIIERNKIKLLFEKDLNSPSE